MTQKGASRWVAILVVRIILTAYIGLTRGELSVPVMGLKALILGQGNQAKQLLVWDFRLPWTVLTVLAGTALGLSGTIPQGTTRNPLMDTEILGTNAGTGLTVILFISFVETISTTTFAFPLVTLVGDLLTAVGILVITHHHRLGLTPVRVVSADVVSSTDISALTLLVTSKINAEKYRFVTIWQTGNIWGSSWFFVGALLPWLVIGLFFAMKRHRLLDILQLRGETTISIGIVVKKERVVSLLLTVMLAASAISVTKRINLLDLLAPYIARKRGFTQQKQVLPLAVLFGGLPLLVSDTIGRLLPGGGEVPIGVTVAIIGAPYFLYLLIKTSDSL